MVFRVTITDTKADVTIDIEDALNQTQVGGLERSICSICSICVYNMTPRKRERDPAEIVGGSRPSPYQPCVPVKGDISKTQDISAHTPRCPDPSIYLASTLRSPPLSPQRKAENNRPVNLVQIPSPALEVGGILEFSQTQCSGKYLPSVPQVKAFPPSDSKAVAEHDEASPSLLLRPKISLPLPRSSARSTRQHDHSAEPTVKAKAAQSAVEQALTPPEQLTPSHHADGISPPAIPANTSTIITPPSSTPTQTPSPSSPTFPQPPPTPPTSSLRKAPTSETDVDPPQPSSTI